MAAYGEIPMAAVMSPEGRDVFVLAGCLVIGALQVPLAV